jgi:hypothetical protein
MLERPKLGKRKCKHGNFSLLIIYVFANVCVEQIRWEYRFNFRKHVTGALSVVRWDVSCKKDEDTSISFPKYLHKQIVVDTGKWVNLWLGIWFTESCWNFETYDSISFGKLY